MGWYAKKIEKFVRLPKPLLIAHISSKSLFALGLGLLLARYFGDKCKLWGWLIILFSLIIAIPSTYRILKK